MNVPAFNFWASRNRRDDTQQCRESSDNRNRRSRTYSLTNTPHTFVGYKLFSSSKRNSHNFFKQDILFRVTQNERFPQDIKDIQGAQAVKTRSQIASFKLFLNQEVTLQSLSRFQKAPINHRIGNLQIKDAMHNYFTYNT